MSLLINNRKYSSLHFVGILGSGMSAIAQFLQWNSIHISGSDRLINNSSTRHIQHFLESLGCCIYKQDGSGVSSDTEALVISTAIEESNPDYMKASSLNIPLFHRSDVLAAIINTKKTIAVAGTSGKSTVAALVFHLLSYCRKKPSLIAGGNCNELVEREFIGNAYNDISDLLVVEADESDGSLIKYKPYISIFLNLSKDHKPIAETLKLFQTLAGQSSNVLTNYDDKYLNSIQPSKTFGLNKKSDFHPDKTKSDTMSVTICKNEFKYLFPFPGGHNMYNLLAALYVCKILECKESTLSMATVQYKGIQRRFNRFETKKGITVIDDYAHNPAKIHAILKTVQDMSPVVFAVFQPHGFVSTKFLLQEYRDVFNSGLRKNDTLYLLPVYYAGGTVNKEVSSIDIAEGLKKCKGTIVTPKNRNDIIPSIVSSAHSGDIVISMGARDPSLPAFAESITRAIDL